MAANDRIGKHLKRLREEAGLNQSQIARFLEVDQSYISKFEKGERQFSIDMLEKLSDLFGCDISALVEEDMPEKTLCFAFRANAIADEDLSAIADINRIALNIGEMRGMLEGNG